MKKEILDKLLKVEVYYNAMKPHYNNMRISHKKLVNRLYNEKLALQLQLNELRKPKQQERLQKAINRASDHSKELFYFGAEAKYILYGEKPKYDFLPKSYLSNSDNSLTQFLPTHCKVFFNNNSIQDKKYIGYLANNKFKAAKNIDYNNLPSRLNLILLIQALYVESLQSGHNLITKEIRDLSKLCAGTFIYSNFDILIAMIESKAYTLIANAFDDGLFNTHEMAKKVPDKLISLKISYLEKEFASSKVLYAVLAKYLIGITDKRLVEQRFKEWEEFSGIAKAVEETIIQHLLKEEFKEANTFMNKVFPGKTWKSFINYLKGVTYIDHPKVYQKVLKFREWIVLAEQKPM